MTEGANDLIQMIESYTDQIERYESLSTWYAAFSIVCIISVIMAAVYLVLKRAKEMDGNRMLYDSILSGVFLIIPSIVTLYLYTFAMNMRKVALYRGYLSFLEEQWNAIQGTSIMMFDGGIIKKYFSFQDFLVNGLGPVIMSVFLVLSMVVGFGLSIYFERQLRNIGVKKVLKMLIAVLLLVCVLFDGVCTYYLSTNDMVVESVIDYCREQGNIPE